MRSGLVMAHMGLQMDNWTSLSRSNPAQGPLLLLLSIYRRQLPSGRRSLWRVPLMTFPQMWTPDGPDQKISAVELSVQRSTIETFRLSVFGGLVHMTSTSIINLATWSISYLIEILKMWQIYFITILKKLEKGVYSTQHRFPPPHLLEDLKLNRFLFT